MNAAKLREYYQQTQLLLSELQALGTDSYGIDRANSKHQQLARLALQLQNGTELLTEQDLRAIWKERFAKLHEDLVSLTALRLQREGQSGEQFWDGCVRLLYAGASAYIQRETELATLQAQESSHEEERVKLETALQTSVMTSQPTQQRESTAKENLELRTRVVVLQQELQRRDADARDLQQQLQAVTRERDGLRSEKEKLLMDCERSTQALDRQAKVIGQLMERSESSVRERDEAVSTLKQVDEDNHVLRVNLHQHTLVVEKLIGLNTEVMDAANKNALIREKLEKQLIEKLQLGEKTDHNRFGKHEHGMDGSFEDDSVPLSTLPLSTLPLSTLPQVDNELSTSKALDNNGYNGAFHTNNSWSRNANQGNQVSESGNKKVNTGGDSCRDHRKSFEEKKNERTSREEIQKQDQNGTDTISKHTQRPIVWTSDMLESINKPSSEETETSNGNNGLAKEEEESEKKARPSVVKGARSILRGVGGRARGFLSYVAGADKVSTEEERMD